ncbi:MAG: hypothetical protein AAFP90_01595 [Planctomycetota bacterium]
MIVAFALVCGAFVTPASATSLFNKTWKAKFADKKENPEMYAKARKAGCNICHIKGHPKKKEARNEYGMAVHKFLKEKDFPRDWVKANPEEAKKKLLEGLEKAGKLKSKDGKSFEEKIKAKELPATDANL